MKNNVLFQYLHQFLQSFSPKEEAMLKKQALLIILSLLLASVVFLKTQEESHIQSGYTLKREGIGGSEYSLPLQVQGLNPQRKENLNITVSPRIYTKEEADKLFSELHDRMESLILPEEESLDGIKTSLQLSSFFPKENIKASWSFSPTALINGKEKLTTEHNLDLILGYRPILEERGKIHHEMLAQDQILEGELELKLSTIILPPKEEKTNADLENYVRDSEDYLYYSPRYIFPIRILPEEKNSLENLRDLLIQKISILNQEERGTEELHLPQEIEGHRIHFSEEKSRAYLYIPLLGLFAAFLLPLKDKEEKKENLKKRANSLELDYSELVSKLVVYLGAGLSLRNAFTEISKQYEYLVESCGLENHPLYDELHTLLNQLKSNIGEGNAYLAFSGRISLRPYNKLISVIEQNRKNGSKHLRLQLQVEMQEAFEMRKATAKRLGEEAGTKLLLPLFMQLFIIMMMILYPAMTSLS